MHLICGFGVFFVSYTCRGLISFFQRKEMLLSNTANQFNRNYYLIDKETDQNI